MIGPALCYNSTYTDTGFHCSHFHLIQISWIPDDWQICLQDSDAGNLTTTLFLQIKHIEYSTDQNETVTTINNSKFQAEKVIIF